MVCIQEAARVSRVASIGRILHHVLCASSGETVDFVVPPEGVANGERVAFAGFEGEPDEVLNPKKKQWDAVQPELKTNTAGVAQYQGVDFGTSKGPCKSAVAEGSIR